jgi:protein gp37/ParB-like chromosome segregation protein Spo0J
MNNFTSTGKRKPEELAPHPENVKIYGDLADSELVESVKQKGILNPLLVTYDNRIISGHRRWDAAKVAGLDFVPVVVFGSNDELDILEALIESNRQRTKTPEQIGREYSTLKRIYNERESRQGKRADLDNSEKFHRTSVNVFTEVRPTRKAAESLGVSHVYAHKAEQVVSTIDELSNSGREDEAKQLRQTLNNGSVRKAYQTVKQNYSAPQVEIPVASKVEPKKDHITLDAWNETSATDRALALATKGTHTFNATNDNIEWASWSWNPVTGCLHGCTYCYARDIASRFYGYLGGVEDRFKPVFYPDRLTAPANTKQPNLDIIEDPVKRLGKQNVFVCSMADLFGKWVPNEWIEAVLRQAWDNPQWNFLFLTKFPIRMAEFEYPDNAWLGTTVDKQWAVERAEKAFDKLRVGGYRGVAWLSCEPMLEKLTFSSMNMFDWLVVGGSSGSNTDAAFKPPFDWTVHLWNQAKKYGLPVYMKTNLGIENEVRVREYPVEL